MYNSSSVNVFDSIAQYSLATAALVTCVTFGFHLKRVLLFLKRFVHRNLCVRVAICLCFSIACVCLFFVLELLSACNMSFNVKTR
jgi:hypothetical protein